MNEFFEAIEKHKDAAIGVGIFILFLVGVIGDALKKRRHE